MTGVIVGLMIPAISRSLSEPQEAARRDGEQSNAGLQLRRAISIQADWKGYLRSMLSRRQLQGFVMPRRW